MIIFLKKNGFTFVEVCISVAILSLVFAVASVVISHARREAFKGYWLQQSIEMLRNTSKQIAIKIKAKNYPSTIVYTHKTGVLASGEDPYDRKIFAFKEKRTYDRSGRLKSIEENPNKWYELSLDISGFSPSDQKTELMFFPICTAEKDIEGKNEDGKVVWTRFLLEPSKNFAYDKLGVLIMEEYTEFLPSTKTYPDRAFSLPNPKIKDKFDNMKGSNYKRKELAKDVSRIDIKCFGLSVKGGRGVDVQRNAVNLVKNVVVFSITCTNPKDNKTSLSDMCAVSTYSGIKACDAYN